MVRIIQQEESSSRRDFPINGVFQWRGLSFAFQEEEGKRGVAERRLVVSLDRWIFGIRLIRLILFVAFVGLIARAFAYGTLLKPYDVAVVVSDDTAFVPSEVLTVEAVDVVVVIIARGKIGHWRTVPHIDGEVGVAVVDVGHGFSVAVEEGNLFRLPLKHRTEN